ncbi:MULTISPECIES: ribosome rescue protein RqcH [unclassified Haladaptatus]|uniref:ribosome rescue protein RqcH n=1 Tax=unclassified Haladaptatus TaxID=2622732 RepID=UPI0023E8EC5B|nr:MULTISPECIES: ribosome rescue protein RqcH [unclassified Haladaptatus]
MDQKRELTSVDLAALVTEFGSYEGAKIDKAYLYDDDLLRLKMRDFERGRIELMIEVGEQKRAHLLAPEHVPDAPGRPPNFAMMLRNRLSGADFAGVEQFEFDRILSFHFTREDQDTTIVAELFGQGNLAVLNEDNEVISSLETVRLKSRTVAPGSIYEFPSSRFHPFKASFEQFVARMEQSDTDLVRTLATQLNFGGLYAEELCTRAGVEKAKDIGNATEDEFQALYDALTRLKDSLTPGNLEPRLYTDEDGRPVDVTPIPLEEHEDLDAEAYQTFNAALDEYFVKLEADDAKQRGKPKQSAGSNRPDFEERIERQQRIIEQQEQAISGFDERADAERARAELLYREYDLVNDILSTVKGAREEGVPWREIEEKFAEGKERGIPAAESVVNVDGSTSTVTITIDDYKIDLDTTQGVEHNADRLYTEAKRIAEKKEGALAAIEDTREELEDLERQRDEWEAGDEDDADETEEAEEIDWLTEQSIPIRKNEQWYERFRWFHTSDGFLVIGGRNANDNEELVKKYLDKGDLFFHTQAHGGPITILKATGPSEPARDVDIPEQSKKEAAQFAVSYSSVWKDGRFADEAYMVNKDQVSKTPESGEYLEKGAFTIRGDRTYFKNTEVGVAVGIRCEPRTEVIGGPPSAIEKQAVTTIELEPGQFAQNDMAKMCYREFRERFTDTSFVRKVASPDKIQEFLPPGGSRMRE